VGIYLEVDRYPSFFEESDRIAVAAQKKQFLFVRAKIVLLVISALLLSVPWVKINPTLTTPVAFSVAVLLVGLIALTVAIQNRGLDSLWINCRAIAEAIKTETWLFMMQAQPYLGPIQTKDAEDLFMNRIGTILRLRPSAASQIAQFLKENPQVTPHMKEVRNADLDHRRDYYIQKRIKNQRNWFSTKAAWNRRREALWFAVAWLLELLAVIAAIAIVFLQDSLVDAGGIISAAGAGVMFWLNARSYKEPAESYGVAANDLELQRNYAINVETEQKLSSLVSDTEGIINREQKIWLARL
jgi:hypothetical protein